MSGSTNPHNWGEHGYVMSGGDVTGFVLACGCRLNIYSATGTLRLDQTFHGLQGDDPEYLEWSSVTGESMFGVIPNDVEWQVEVSPEGVVRLIIEGEDLGKSLREEE